MGDDCSDIVASLKRLQEERERQEVIAQLQEIVKNNKRRRSKLRFIRRLFSGLSCLLPEAKS